MINRSLESAATGGKKTAIVEVIKNFKCGDAFGECIPRNLNLVELLEFAKKRVEDDDEKRKNIEACLEMLSKL
jgi:hypothetical protein